MKKPILLIAAVLTAITGYAQTGSNRWNYPEARTKAFDTLMFGTKLSDPYFWMSRPEHKEEMEAFARAQNDLFTKTMASIPGDSLIQAEMNALRRELNPEFYYIIEATENNVIYYGEDEQGYGLLMESVKDLKKKKIMDYRLAINGRNWNIRGWKLAHQKPWIALMLVERGDANPHIRIWDYEKQELLPDSIGRVMFNSARGVSMAWMPGDKGLLYSQTPEGQTGHQLYFNGRILLHSIGTNQSEDIAVFGWGVNPAIPMEPFETPFITSYANSDYIRVHVNHGLEEPYAYYVDSKKLDGANTPWEKVPGRIKSVSIDGDYLYIITPDQSNYVLKRLHLNGNEPMQILMQGQDLPIATDKGVVITDRYAFVAGRKVGDMCIYKINLDGSGYEKIPLPEKGSIENLFRISGNEILLTQFSATQSDQPWLLDVRTGNFSPWPRPLNNIDYSHLIESKVIEVPARDGVSVPVTLVYKMGTALQEQNRMWLGVYGSAGTSRDINPPMRYMPWFERGGIFAYAHVRGGGEKGEDWIRDGSIPYVENRINDFIDVTRYLIDENYTTSDRLVIDGASAGTFTIGTSVNRHPELFAVALFEVGVPDQVTTWSTASYRHGGRHEGIPVDAESLKHALAISSIYNIPTGKQFPAMLITNGATDYAIELHTGTRYVASLQKAQTGDRPVFQAVNWEIGHGNIVSMPDKIRFALWQTGHPDFQPEEE